MNLITMKDSDITHVKIIQYPDGQRNIELDMSYFNPKYETIINARITSFNSLELLLCVVGALKRADIELSKINFKYLFGLRSDRVFSPGMPNYLKDVIAPIVNSIECTKNILYPHSIRGLNNIEVNKSILSGIQGIEIDGDESLGKSYYSFKKVRDKDGNIKVYLPKETKEYINNIKSNTIIIHDDLCDGGATFIEEGKILKEVYPNYSLHLSIAHGIFSKGFDELLKYYTSIITTNSHQDFTDNLPQQVEVIKVI